MPFNAKIPFCSIFPESAVPILVDVGAGDVGTDPTQLGPFERIAESGPCISFGFDGVERNLTGLQARATPNCRYIHGFVADGGPRTFYRTNHALTGGLYRPNTALLVHYRHLAEYLHVVEEMAIETVALDDLSEIERFDGLKIDVQGAELDVLRGGEHKLRAATLVLCEVEFIELYEGQPLFADIDQFLRAQGFMLHHLRPPSLRMIKPGDPGPRPGVGSQTAWSDALYVRDIRERDSLSDAQLMTLARMLHDGFTYFDAVAHCLETLDRRDDGDRLRRYVHAIGDDYFPSVTAASRPRTGMP